MNNDSVIIYIMIEIIVELSVINNVMIMLE